MSSAEICDDRFLPHKRSVRVSIRGLQNKDESHIDQYFVSVAYTDDRGTVSWEIRRSLEDYNRLRECLRMCGLHVVDGGTNIDGEESLEAELNNVLVNIGDDIWNSEDLVAFLDSGEQTRMCAIQSRFLAQEVRRLNAVVEDQSAKISALQTNYFFLSGVVQDLLNAFDSGSSIKKGLTKRGDLIRALHVSIPSNSNTNEECDATDEAHSSHGSSFLSLNMADLHTLRGTQMPTDGTLRTASVAGSQSTDLTDTARTLTPRGLMPDKGLVSPTPVHDGVKRTSFADGSAPGTLSTPVPGSDLQTRSASGSGSSSAPSTPHFAIDLHPTDEMCAYYSAAVEHILQSVRPNNSHMLYRHSVVTMLRKQVRLCLNSNAFPTGLHDILCSLPDDPIGLSVIVPKPLLSSWHVTLTDRLNLLNERLATSGNVEIPYPDEEEILMHLPDDFQHALRHEIGNVSHTKLSVNYCVNLQVDHSTEVEILCNARQDLCLLAFLEEMAALVGKNDLFKRSLLLIRAWWFYETASYVGTPIKHYLKDSNICIMVCAVFNQYHARINTPLQALCLFLAEYSAYDGATQAITLQGIVPFKSPTSSHPVLQDAQPTHLLSSELIERHWNVFNLSASTADVSDYEAFIKSSSSDDVHYDDGSGIAGASIVVGLHNPEHELQRSAPGGIERVNMKNLSQHNLHYFERQVFNIVHPFNHTNMVAEKLSARRQMRLHKAFQIGATEIAVYLKQNIHNANNSGDLLHYFPNVLARFADHGEAAANSPGKDSVSTDKADGGPSIPVDPRYFSDAEKLNARIMYCNMMLESVVTEPALLTLSTEILAVKGPLPVGEIGKLLAETTSIGNLSQKLKEKFGGLKKFLERFQNVFALSNDHPFNPNVLLRSALSAEHLDLIDRGIFPHQLVQKSKKASTPSAKKKKSASFTGVMIGPDGNLTSASSPAITSTGAQVFSSPHVSALKTHGSGAVPLGAGGGGSSALSSPHISSAHNAKHGKGTLGSGGSGSAGSPSGSHKTLNKSYNQFTPYHQQPAPPTPQQQQQYGVHHGGGGGGHNLYAQAQHLQQQQQQQQQHMQQQGGPGAFHNQYGAMPPRQTPPPPGPTSMSPHLLYGPGAGGFGPPQPLQSGLPHNQSGYLSHSSSASSMSTAPGGVQAAFNRSFRVGSDVSDDTGFGLDAFRNSQSGPPGGAVRSTSSGSGLSGVYLDDILAGPSALDPALNFGGHRMSAGNSSAQSQLMSNLRMGTHDLSSPSVLDEAGARPRLQSGGGHYAGLEGHNAGGLDGHGSYGGFSAFRTPMSPRGGPPLNVQQQAQGQTSPNHTLYGPAPTSHAGQQGTQQGGAQHGHHDASYLRDFSQF